MIQKAKSGHPGLPLGAAAAAYELWAHHMHHNPADPHWENRDRFVLSGGHGSMMLYSLLHLFGYGDLSLDELKQFRQLGSLTPGHPEYGHTVGVEATTGPLGAGMGMAVGMAMAEAHLAAVFNREGFPVVDHYTFVLGGDGCMMEGISSEAMSLAGTLKLGKLIVLYDSNSISIEGSTDIAFRENVQKRFEAFGFQTITVEDGNDLASIGAAIEEAKADRTRPSFITVKTQIGYGCPAKQGKASAHGEPLGEENVKATSQDPGLAGGALLVPDEVYDYYRGMLRSGEAEDAWNQLFDAYARSIRRWKPLGRSSSRGAERLWQNTEFWRLTEEKPQASRPYVATFFVFSDYTKPMARLAALMKLPVTYVFTHDSIGVGEDGPTHEPVEQLAMLRALPNFNVFRPADATETEAAWYSAVTSEKTPTVLVLTRQNLIPVEGTSKDALRGGYILSDCEGTPEAILMASGSEVSLAVEAKKILEAEGKKIRIVSMPCVELFEKQDAAYKEAVLPDAVRKRVAVEALSGMSWYKYVGLDGKTVTLDHFGASAPAGILFEKFGFTAEHVADTVRSLF